MSFRPHPKSFPSARVPILLNIVRAVPKGDPNPKRGSDGTEYLYSDDKLIVIRDAFPKSTEHFLVLPRDTSLQSLNDLRPHHVPLLEGMMRAAERVQELVIERRPELATFRFISGFHSIPSLPMLHMHHLSMDLESEKLKNKKHYNSFATFFFLPASKVLADLQTNGHVTVNQNVEQLERMENGPMKCLWCGFPLSNMPMMKSHVPSCPKNQSRLPTFVKKKKEDSQVDDDDLGAGLK